jgi:hypothetical protein
MLAFFVTSKVTTKLMCLNYVCQITAGGPSVLVLLAVVKTQKGVAVLATSLYCARWHYCSSFDCLFSHCSGYKQILVCFVWEPCASDNERCFLCRVNLWLWIDVFHPFVLVQLQLIKIENYSQTQQFYYYSKRRHVSTLLLSHLQACAVSLTV